MKKAQSKNKKKKRKAGQGRPFSTVLSAVIIIILAFAVSAIFRANYFDKDYYILGFRSFITLSDSMNPVIKKGGLLITQRVNPDTIRTGDIITYREGSEIRTQRVVEAVNSDGGISFITRGDASEGVNSRAVPAGDVIGRFVYSVGFAGNVMLAMRNPVNMIFCVTGTGILILSLDAVNKRIKKSLRAKKRQRRHSLQNHYITGVNMRQSFTCQSANCFKRKYGI